MDGYTRKFVKIQLPEKAGEEGRERRKRKLEEPVKYTTDDHHNAHHNSLLLSNNYRLSCNTSHDMK